MASASSMLSLLLLFLPLTFALTLATDDLISTTCSPTSFPDLCSTTLRSSPASAQATTSEALCAIFLDISAANAKDTASYATTLTATSATAANGCAARYQYAAQALLEAAQSVRAGNSDYADVQASAAKVYPGECRNLWTAIPYPAELQRREDALTKMCTVAEQIVAKLDA